MNISPCFITFEGIDGCGKSTQVKRISERLTRDGIPHIVTREPGGPDISEQIRKVILHPDNNAMSNECELLLYLASRAQHMHQTIKPALAQGKVVLCDRFADATMAYQGFGRGLSLKVLEGLNAFATGSTAPDLTFIFDISLDLAYSRLTAMNKAPDRLENEGREFFGHIREGYLALASAHPRRIVLVAGEKSIDELTTEVYTHVMAKIGLS